MMGRSSGSGGNGKSSRVVDVTFKNLTGRAPTRNVWDGRILNDIGAFAGAARRTVGRGRPLNFEQAAQIGRDLGFGNRTYANDLRQAYNRAIGR